MTRITTTRSVARALLALLALAAILSLRSALFSGSSSGELNDIFKKALQARQEKNYPLYLEQISLANGLIGGHPDIMQHLASALLLNGRKGDAYLQLEKIRAMGVYVDLAQSPLFREMNSDKHLRELIPLFAENLQPLVRGEKAFELDDPQLITEGIAFDKASGSFLLGSIHKSKIVIRDQTGGSRDFSSPSDGLWAVFGIKPGREAGTIWACTSALPNQLDFKAELAGRAALVKYELKSGKLLRRVDAPDGEHLFGDLAVCPVSGEIFVSDGSANIIYRYDEVAAPELQIFVKDGPFFNIQGLDLSGDGRTLFVADYLAGIFAIDRASGTVKQLRAPEKTFLGGIDGLYFFENSLIAIQNGMAPQRIIRIFLDDSPGKVRSVKILERNNPAWNEPTLGVIVNKAFFYIANSQWGAFDANGRISAPEKLKKPMVFGFDLKD